MQMGRPRMVTRTIEATKVTAMCVDTEKAEVTTEVVEVAGTYKTATALDKAVRKVLEIGTIKLVQIVDIQLIGKVYGMSEQKFMELAEELDATTRKAIATEGTEQTESEEVQ